MFALALAALAVRGYVVPVSDPLLYFSEHNWARSATSATTVNPGAYLKFSVTDQTQQIEIRTLPVDGGSSNGTEYLHVLYSVGGWDLVEVAMYTNTSSIILPAEHLNPGGATTDVILYIYNSMQSRERWTQVGSANGAALIVTGVVLDAGAKLTATKVTPLRSKRCLFFGDSITEGVASQCVRDPTCVGEGDLCNNAATKTWGTAVAAALDCEYSQVGFGGLGWSVSGGGGVVPLFTPGNPAESSWNQHFAGAPRSFANLDYIFVLHATNDGLRAGNASIAAVTASATAWLTAQRAAAGAATDIFLTVPFGGFGANLAPAGSLKAAFDAYQAAAKEPKTHFIDMGASASKGLTHFGFSSIESCGGIHPRGGTQYTARHGELGAMVAVHAVRAMAGMLS